MRSRRLLIVAASVIIACASVMSWMGVRTEPSSGGSPCGAVVTVPGHREARIDVAFSMSETLESPGLSADTEFGGTYPTAKGLLRVDR